LAKLAVSAKYQIQKASRSLLNININREQLKGEKKRTDSRSEFLDSVTNGTKRDDTSTRFGVSMSVDTSGVSCRGIARRFPFDDEEQILNIFSLFTQSASLRRLGGDGRTGSGVSVDWRLREGTGPSIISRVGSADKSITEPRCSGADI
jgi:hypothetical protein